MLLDQLLFAPFFLSTFIASLMTLEVCRKLWLARAGAAMCSPNQAGMSLPDTHTRSLMREGLLHHADSFYVR